MLSQHSHSLGSCFAGSDRSKPCSGIQSVIEYLRALLLSLMLMRFHGQFALQVCLGIGGWKHSSLMFSTKQADKFWHFTRSHWRLQRLINWLQESRRDSQIAQSTDIVPCLELIRTLRKIHFKVSQNARAVMLGGFTTEATMKAERARELSCRYCGLAPPFLEHILWDCPHFVRWPSRPPDPLAARLGWTWPLDISVANACQRHNDG